MFISLYVSPRQWHTPTSLPLTTGCWHRLTLTARFYLPWYTWSLMNRFCLCRADLHKSGLAQLPCCDCGQSQTINHIVDTCQLTKFEADWWCSHMAGIYSDCSTRQIINNNKTESVPSVIVSRCHHMLKGRWVCTSHSDCGGCCNLLLMLLSNVLTN